MLSGQRTPKPPQTVSYFSPLCDSATQRCFRSVFTANAVVAAAHVSTRQRRRRLCTCHRKEGSAKFRLSSSHTATWRRPSPRVADNAFFFGKVNIKKINKQKGGVVVVKRGQKTRPPPTAALRFFYFLFFFLWLSLDISVSLCYTFTIAPTDIRRIAFIKVRRVSNPSIITSVNSGRRGRHHEGEKRRLKQRRRLRILSEPFNQRGGARRRLCRRRRRHQPRCPASMLTCKSPSSSH